MKKVKRVRQGVITEETSQLIKDMQEENDKKDGDYIYICTADALR